MINLIDLSCRSEVDVSFVGLGQDRDRSEASDFTIGLFNVRAGVHVRKTDSVRPNYMVYANVFLGSLWVCILATLGLLTAGLLVAQAAVRWMPKLEVRS